MSTPLDRVTIRVSGRVSLTETPLCIETPLDREPPCGQRPPSGQRPHLDRDLTSWTETPKTETRVDKDPHSGQRPPGHVDLWCMLVQRASCEQNHRHG